MPTLVKTLIGHVTAIWGTALVRTPTGHMHVLKLGDVVHQGDVILTSQDGIVQLTDGEGEVHKAAVVPQPDGELDRVISGLDLNDPAAATAAGLSGGENAGDLGPGLRVDRISESTNAEGLLTDAANLRTVEIFDGATNPKNQNAVRLEADSSDITASEEGAPVNLHLTPPTGGNGSPTITVTHTPDVGQIIKADGTPVTAGTVLTPADLPGLAYVPPADYNGTTPVGGFGYTVVGTDGSSASGGTTIHLLPVNDAPIANPDSATTDAGTPVVINVLANDTDADGDPLTVRSATVDPARGTVTVNVDGTLTFHPAAGTSGPVTLTYTVSDPSGATSTTTVSVDVHAPGAPPADNAAPVASSSAITAAEHGAPVSLGLTAPTDADGDVLTTTITSLPTAGHVQLADGSAVAVGQTLTASQLTGLQYVPPADYAPGQSVGSFGYSVSDGHTQTTGTTTIAVTAVNDAPVAAPDVSTTPINTPHGNIDVLGNDTDPDHDALSVTGATVDPQFGTVTVNPDGTLNFTPAGNVTGDVPISYSISDGHGGTSTSTLTVTVGPNTPPVAADQVVTTAEDQSRPFVLADFAHGYADPDVGQQLTAIRIDTLPTAGSLTLDGNPVAAGTVLTPDQISHLAFTPAPNANGDDYAHFQFSVEDSAGAFSAVPNTLTVNVTPVNDAPVAIADVNAITEGMTTAPGIVTGSVTPGTAGQDSDIDGSFTVTGVNAGTAATDAHNAGASIAGTYGSVVINPDGSYVYTLDNTKPATNALVDGQHADEVYTYTITDDHGATATATLTIGITGTDEAPVAHDNSVTGPENHEITFTWQQFGISDADTPASQLSLHVTALPASGELRLYDSPTHWTVVTLDSAAIGKADIDAGNLRFMPAPGESGDNSFTAAGPGNMTRDYAVFQYEATDGALHSSPPATMTIDITPVAEAPVLAPVPATWQSYSDNMDDGDPTNGGMTWTGVFDPRFGGVGSVENAPAYAQWVYNDVQNPHTSQLPSENHVVELEADGVGGNVISSTLHFDRAGQVVDIGFDMIARANGPQTADLALQSFQVFWNGVAVGNAVYDPVATQWTTEILQVTSVAGDNVLSFHPTDLDGTYGAILDNISVSTVGDAAVDRVADIALPPHFANFTDNVDHSETHTVSLSGVPIGATLSDGTGPDANTFTATAGHTTADVSSWALDHLTIQAPTDFVGTIDLTATATATENSNQNTQSASTVLSATFMPDEAHLSLGTLGDDTMNVSDGAGHRLVGLDGNDTLVGGVGNDVLQGGTGNDHLTGGTGADVFKWSLGDQGSKASPAADTVTDFDNGARGDQLDLRDLLVGEHAGTGGDPGNLANYLHFSAGPAGTTIEISSTGGFANGKFDAGAVDQTITLNNVNLVGGFNDDNAVIKDLLTRGKLVTDHG